MTSSAARKLKADLAAYQAQYRMVRDNYVLLMYLVAKEAPHLDIRPAAVRAQMEEIIKAKKALDENKVTAPDPA